MSPNDTVYLTSPNYPNHHPVHVNSTWYFTAQDQDGVYKITFLDLDLNVDYLQIGKTHDVLSNDTIVSIIDYWYSPETVWIHHTHIYVRFKASDWTEPLRGFFIKVERTSQNEGMIKDYSCHASPHTEFSDFLTIDTRQYELPNYFFFNGSL